MDSGFKSFIGKRREKGLLRELKSVELEPSGILKFKGKEYVNFSSNDYLGLSSHPEIIGSIKNYQGKVVGASASRLMTGSTRLHHELEEKTAELKGREAALLFNSGYQANVGVISAVCGRGDAVFSDRLNHASIVDGIKLSGAKLYRFRHNDASHLEELLARNRGRHGNALIVTETVFSMDGDLAPIQEMIRLKNKFKAMLMSDEAHATGIFGAKGAGLLEILDPGGECDIAMGTFSKALGGFGAYVASSRVIRDHLVNTCRSFIYSTALPVPLVAANIRALDIVKEEPERREKLLSDADHLRDKLKKAGLEVKGASQIVPVMIGENDKAVELSERLKKRGYWVTPVRPPTVPEGSARLRISVSYCHGRELLDKFSDDLQRAVKG